jgi:hypothetical protein
MELSQNSVQKATLTIDEKSVSLFDGISTIDDKTILEGTLDLKKIDRKPFLMVN